MSRHNIILEFDLKNTNPELFDRLEKALKNHELFLAEWQRDGDKIRVLSEFSEIKAALFAAFENEELKKLPYVVIPFEEDVTA